MDAVTGRPAWWCAAVTLCVAALVLSGACLLPYLGNGQDIALVRNSLVYQTSDSEALFVAPPTSPVQETRDADWRAAASAAGALDTQRSDFERALAIVRHLDQPGYPHGGMIALPSMDTYHIIKESGRGFCADYTQVFLALAAAAGLIAREWGISFAGYSGAGHAVIEIYARESKAWIMIDVFNGFYVSDENDRPLSLPAVRERILRGDQHTLRVQLVDDVLPFPSPQRALHYLARGMPRAYLWLTHDATNGDGHALLDTISRHSRAVAQLLAIATGQAPRMVLMPAPEQRPALLELRMLRLACLNLLCVPLLLVGLMWWRVRQGSRKNNKAVDLV